MFINDFDPVAFNIFSLEIRWYSLSYIFGAIFGWIYCKKYLIKKDLYQKLFDDYLFYIIFGIIIGGRIGYTLIYNFSYYLKHPIEVLMIWQGGMSFHGAVVGVILATIYFAKTQSKCFLFLRSCRIIISNRNISCRISNLLILNFMEEKQIYFGQ